VLRGAQRPVAEPGQLVVGRQEVERPAELHARAERPESSGVLRWRLIGPTSQIVVAGQVARYREEVLARFPDGTRVSAPRGGFVLWVELPGGVDALVLQERALARDDPWTAKTRTLVGEITKELAARGDQR